MWRWMFSSTTMASSTTMPMASTAASSVRVLIENPNITISPQAPISETGMVMMGIRVARKVRRKKKMIAATSTVASRMVLKTLSIEALMNTPES